MDSRIKCIFCGFCLNETGLNEHMKEFHKIRTLYLKPSQKEASTQITDEDRYLIYPGKRKSVDMKFLTSTPKKARLDNTDASFNMFNETNNDFRKAYLVSIYESTISMKILKSDTTWVCLKGLSRTGHKSMTTNILLHSCTMNPQYVRKPYYS